MLLQLEERQREGERHRKDTNTAFPTQVRYSLLHLVPLEQI